MSQDSPQQKKNVHTKLEPLENAPKTPNLVDTVNKEALEEEEKLIVKKTKTQPDLNSTDKPSQEKLLDDKKQGTKAMTENASIQNINVGNQNGVKNDPGKGKKDSEANKDVFQDTKIYKKKEVSDMRIRAKRFISSRFAIIVIVSLISLYALLVLAVIAIEDEVKNEVLKDKILHSAYWAELIILCLFQIEICISVFGQGFRFYFRDGWLVFDEAIILISFGLVICELEYVFEGKSSAISTTSHITRGIFRFFRIFLLIRKVSNFKKIKILSSVKTPAEKIIELLIQVKDYFDSMDIIQDIEWTIEMISQNKIYEPIIGGGNGEEMNDWVNFGARKEQQEITDNSPEGGNKQKLNRLKSEFISKDKLNLGLFKQLGIPTSVINVFSQVDGGVDDISFDCFELTKISKGFELSYLIIYLCEVTGIFQSLTINPKTLQNFIVQIQDGYKPNPYHNKLHAFDVTQTVNFLIKKCKFYEVAKLNFLDMFVLYVGAACHDYEHPGIGNGFLVNTVHQMALEYNDASVLENHHISASFIKMQANEYNITAGFSKEDYKNFREKFIAVILCTDMAKHFTDMAKLKSRIQSADFEPQGKDKIPCMEAVLHSADISNPIKSFNVYSQWTDRIIEEFWNQGDKERELGMTLTYLCDKYTINKAKSQQGFIDFVCKPMWTLTSNIVPELEHFMHRFDDNKSKYLDLVPFEEENMQKRVQERDETEPKPEEDKKE